MLEILCKRDKDWRKMAFHICKCQTLADDLVQEMYLQFSNYNKEVNDFYVYFAIKQIYIRSIQRQKIKTVELVDNFNIDFETYDFELDNFKESVLNKVDQLPFFERQILKLTTQEISQRKLAKETGINYVTINKTVKESKEKIWKGLKK